MENSASACTEIQCKKVASKSTSSQNTLFYFILLFNYYYYNVSQKKGPRCLQP